VSLEHKYIKPFVPIINFFLFLASESETELKYIQIAD